MQEGNSDTKTHIFNASLRLFCENGYENVSVRDIANAVGIKAASIYNHYEGKEQILQACYDFYLENRYNQRLTRDKYEQIIRNGTKEDIMNIFNYSFEDSIHDNMAYAVFVVYSRFYTDARARKILISEINDSMQYQKEVFGFGIETGRIGEFKVPTVSLLFLSARLFSGVSDSIQSLDNAEWINAKVDFFEELVKMIPFKY